MRRFASLLIVAALALGAAPAFAEKAGGLDVAVDHARILKIPRAAGTIIIGNPSIVDVAIHDAETLVLTGRSFGMTNVVVLDAGGEVVLDDDVTVTSREDRSVRVYRQAARTTYSCSPQCEPKVTVGDEDGSFSQALGQFQSHEAMVTTGQQ
ncbi:pilus assembly protein N-terminal domain-containing protein [Aureimonas ureilytica]|uniref:pilus assembly protein N-terminal domain-containing protein n=1 Tax=Aureimonas ureilytica TaxID=401562 RepID=UPI00037F1CA4|nr:pilus assembly protein N-terminal domain-containing protein [Aureimonas ureilytica]